MIIAFICLILIVFLVSKEKSNINPEYRKIIKANYNKNIIIPDSLIYLVRMKEINNNYKEEILRSSPYKIFVMVSGGCPPCTQEILQWAEFSDRLLAYNNLKIYFVIRGTKLSYFKQTYASDIPIDDNILIDSSDLFVKINDLPYYRDLNTVLVNNENKILLIGNLVGNEALQNLFIETIKNDKK